MEPSWTRDGTHVPCVGGQILNHWAIREVPMLLSDGCRVLPYLGVKPDSAASTHSLVFVFFNFIFNWKILTLQYCDCFCHMST